MIFKTGSKHYQNIFKRFAAKPVRTQNMLNKLKDNFIFLKILFTGRGKDCFYFYVAVAFHYDQSRPRAAAPAGVATRETIAIIRLSCVV